MNKEIKEILDKLQKKKTIYEYQRKNNSSFNDDEYEASLLLDYITNLQEENKRLKEENKDNEQLIETQLRGLEKQKQIIEKAVEYIKEHSSNGEQFMEWFECTELLNILRGKDE